MEYREVFDRDGTATGQIVEKHADHVPGQYFRHAIIVMKTMDSPPPGQGEGIYVMQQRSLKARFYAGKWDVTGGGVEAGETSKEAAAREAFEELGIRVDADQLRLFHQFRMDWEDGTGLLLDVFACRVAIPSTGFKINPHEVNDVRLAPYSVFAHHVLDHNDEAFGEALDQIERQV